MANGKIISALIGLIGACNNNPKTEKTDRVVIKSLAFSHECPEFSDSELSYTADEMVYEIHAEKNRISPGCMTCMTPCGNTSDYDMDRIYNADENIRKIKLDILSEIEESAGLIYSRDLFSQIREDDILFLYKALTYVSCDLEESDLQSILNDTKEAKRKIKEKTAK